LVQRLGYGSSWRTVKFVNGAILSGLVFVWSLIVIYILIPPVKDGPLFSILKVGSFLTQSGSYEETAYSSPSKNYVVRFICFEPYYEGHSFAFLSVDRMFLFQQRMSTLELYHPSCSVWAEKVFSWSSEERFFYWSNSPEAEDIAAPSQGKIRVF
jgi:hypothetical protein